MIKFLPTRFREKTLDNIKGYKTVIHHCRQFKAGQSITFCGNVGRGKTHMAAGTARVMARIPIPEHIRKNTFTETLPNRATKTLYLSTIGFLMQCNDLATNGNKKEYLDELIREPRISYNGGTYDPNKILGWDLIILDDFGAERLTEAARQNLFYLINGRYENCQSMIITTNLSMAQIHEQEPRIASRLAEMGKIFELTGEDFRTL